MADILIAQTYRVSSAQPITTINPQLIATQIQFNSPYCGLKLTAIPLPANCSWIGIIRSGELIAANTQLTINCGDNVLVLALQPGIVPRLKHTLQQTHSVTWSVWRCSLPIEAQVNSKS